MAAVKEPTADELSIMTIVGDIFHWAGVPGDTAYMVSLACLRLVVVGAEASDGATGTINAMEVENFASIDASALEYALNNWKFSKVGVQPGLEHEEIHGSMDTMASPLMKAKARAAHRAACIWASLELSRSALD